MNRNDLLTLAQRLREYNHNPHHINPTSEAFHKLIDEAASALSILATPPADAADMGGQAGEEVEVMADALDRQSVITGDYIARCQRLAAERDALAAENEALVRNLRGKHSLVGATYEHLICQRDEALAKLAELEALEELRALLNGGEA